MAGGAVTCDRCSAPVVGSPKFCGECGAALGARPPTTELRKTVTTLFCDVRARPS